VLLSILIPTLPERIPFLTTLVWNLQQQMVPGETEFLALMDNRTMSLGDKRNRMMDLASGKFFIHLDDDDELQPGAVAAILRAIKDDPEADVISYNSTVYLEDDPPFVVRTGMGFENEQVRRGPEGRWEDIRRKPWHWCAWYHGIAKKGAFKGRVDEDWQWLQQVLPHVDKEHHIDQALHVYRFRAKQSFCQAETASSQ